MKYKGPFKPAAMKKSNYSKLYIMLALSFVLMYVIMFLNVDDPSHIYINMTRFYMTLLMVCAMAVLMVAMMPVMYANKKKNTIIITSSAVVFILAFAGVHKQAGIGDTQYMKGMIPHHSIAIMTSQNAHIKDARVRKLADGIIKTQKKEIAEMKEMIDSLKSNK
jgi:peptidoglycan/LPS O-acetylase OafA/YrhL